MDIAARRRHLPCWCLEVLHDSGSPTTSNMVQGCNPWLLPQVQFSQRNLPANKARKFVRSVALPEGYAGEDLPQSLPTELADCTLQSWSPSGELCRSKCIHRPVRKVRRVGAGLMVNNGAGAVMQAGSGSGTSAMLEPLMLSSISQADLSVAEALRAK